MNENDASFTLAQFKHGDTFYLRSWRSFAFQNSSFFQSEQKPKTFDQSLSQHDDKTLDNLFRQYSEYIKLMWIVPLGIWFRAAKKYTSFSNIIIARSFIQTVDEISPNTIEFLWIFFWHWPIENTCETICS